MRRPVIEPGDRSGGISGRVPRVSTHALCGLAPAWSTRAARRSAAGIFDSAFSGAVITTTRLAFRVSPRSAAFTSPSVMPGTSAAVSACSFAMPGSASPVSQYSRISCTNAVLLVLSRSA